MPPMNVPIDVEALIYLETTEWRLDRIRPPWCGAQADMLLDR